MENNWWYISHQNNALPKNIINDNKKDDNEYEPFMVDSVPKKMKRNHNSIKNDIIDILYNKNNDNLIISNKKLKLD